MPTTPLQLRYIRIQVLHLLLCFAHTPHICHLFRNISPDTTLSQIILSPSFTYNILPRNFVTQLFDIQFFLIQPFKTTDPPASCLSFLPHSASTTVSDYGKMLTCGVIRLSGSFNFGIHMSRFAWIEACLHMMLHMLPSMHCCITWWQGPSRASQQTSSHGSWGTHCF